VDCNGKVTLRAGMNDCDDASALPCKIIAETLYTNGPMAEFVKSISSDDSVVSTIQQAASLMSLILQSHRMILILPRLSRYIISEEK